MQPGAWNSLERQAENLGLWQYNRIMLNVINLEIILKTHLRIRTMHKYEEREATKER